MRNKVRKYFLFLGSLFLLTVLLSNFFFINWAEAVEIKNPLKYKTFKELIYAITNFLFQLALAVAPLMIVVAGYYFVTSAGNPDQIETAKKIILYTLVGLLIILLSKGIIALFQEVLGVKK